MSSAPRKATLQRRLGLTTLVFYGLGNILGAGIYVLIGSMAGHAGMLTPVAFIVSAGIALFSMLTYAELSSHIPVSAGEAAYLQQGLRSRALSRLVGLMVASAGIVATATLIRGVHGYLLPYIDFPFWLVVCVLVALLGLVTVWGISQSANTAAAITLVEIGGLLLIIWVGGDQLGALPKRLDEFLAVPETGYAAAILPAAFLAFFAFLGFEDMVNTAEEVRDPERNLPLAMMIALGLACVLYLLVALVAVMNVEPTRLAASDAPLALVFEQATGEKPHLLTAISVLAVINGALVPMIMASRVLYGMADKGLLWSSLAIVHPKTHTPVRATLLVIVFILLLSLWFPVEKLAAGTSFLILGVFSLVNTSLLVIKIRDRPRDGHHRYPIWVPVAGLLSCLGLAAGQIFS